MILRRRAMLSRMAVNRGKVGKVEEDTASGGGVDDNVHDFGGKESAEVHQKQNEHEIQVSEESSFTQNQYAKISQESIDHSVAGNGKAEVRNVDQQDQSSKTEEANKSEETTNGDKNAETKINALDVQKQQQEEQNQPEKPVTFSDETMKDQPATQESKDTSSKDEGQQGVTLPHVTKHGSEDVQERNSTTTSQDTKQDTTILPNSGIPKESNESKKSWLTEATESNKEKERHKVDAKKEEGNTYGYTWQLCNVTAGPDYYPVWIMQKLSRNYVLRGISSIERGIALRSLQHAWFHSQSFTRDPSLGLRAEPRYGFTMCHTLG